MKFKSVKIKSDKKKIRDAIGKIHLELLRKKRGDRCEICGKQCVTGRFHIIRVAQAPRLEFVDENVLLSCWMPCHYAWHHNGADDKRNASIVLRIKELRGENYQDTINAIQAYKTKHDTMYLLALLQTMKQELKSL